MSRKKGMGRKLKTDDDYSRHPRNASERDHNRQVRSEEYLHKNAKFPSRRAEEQFPAHCGPPGTNRQTFGQVAPSIPRQWNDKNPKFHPHATLDSSVKVKTEPNSHSGNRTYQNETDKCQGASSKSKEESSSSFVPAKIKRERLSLDSSLCSRSQFPKTTPTMDLGSHFEQSLSSLQSSTKLTWSQLLEAKNLPRVHAPERPQQDVSNRIQESDPTDMVLCTTDDDLEDNSTLSTGADKPTSLEKSSAPDGKEKPATSSSKRFSKNHNAGGNLLDLSKKIIPAEIRRVLASKYGVSKRHDEGHPGVVPNLNKSRSRFTHSSKKSGLTDSEDGSIRTETVKPAGVSEAEKESERSKGLDRSQISSSSTQEAKHNSLIIPKSRSVSPTEYSSGPKSAIPAKILNRRRFSSSMYEGKSATQASSFLPLEQRKTVALHSRGFVDLGSHYVNLLKDSSPPVSGRNSRSPYDEAETASAVNRSDNGKAGSLSEHRGTVPVRAPRDLMSASTKGEQMVNLAPRDGRRFSFADDLGENSRNSQPKGETNRHEVSDNANDGRLVRVSGRSSRSPVNGDSQSRIPNQSTVDLGSTSTHHFDQLGNALHSTARSLSRSSRVEAVTGTAGGTMIDLNSRTSQPNGRVSPGRNKSPFDSTHSNEGQSRPAEPMIELGSYLGSANYPIPRSSSRSSVTSDRPSSREKAMIELGGKQCNENPDSAEPGYPRSLSKSSTTSSLAHEASPNREPEAMSELGGTGQATGQQRSSSRSPHLDHSGPASREDAMIDLGSMRHIHERRGAPRMKPLDRAMIDLSSMETPSSPLSPGFGVLPFSGFPSQVYRPHIRPGFPYKSRSGRGFPPRGTSPGIPRGTSPVIPRGTSPGIPRGTSPGFSPRLPFGPGFTYPPNLRYHMPRSPMIDLGSFGKSNDFQTLPSSRPSEIQTRLVPMTSARELPKRRHSLDSHNLNEPAKKPRVAGERPEGKPAESGVRLNVNDLLELEREEQKYIQDLTLAQAQLTEVQYKMQRMRQEMDRLRSLEMEIKKRIEVVRAKRVKILKDAQDHEGSQGRKGAPEGYKGDEACGSASPGFQDYVVKRGNGVMENSSASKTGASRSLPEGASVLMEETGTGESGNLSNPEKNSDGHVIADNSSEDRSADHNTYKHGNLSNTSDPRYPIASTDTSSIHRAHNYPTMSASSDMCIPKLGRAGYEKQATQQAISTEIETFESSSGSTITLNSDGTMVLRKTQAGSNQLARKGSTTMLEEVCAEFGSKETEYNKLTSNESQQFLGSLEITSTTEEPLVTDHDGQPKEVLAEEEKEHLASRLRRDQDKISSTVTSLEIEQDETSVGCMGEMDFGGHTSAVCCILPYKTKLFSASADRTVKMFDLKTGACITTFEGHKDAVNCLQISGDGSKTDKLFTGANDHTVRVYNVKSDACIDTFTVSVMRFPGRVMCLHVDFGKLFVGLSSGYVRVIDLKTSTRVDDFNCHAPSIISCLSSASEGQRSLLCTGSFDSTISIRDESTGLLLRHIKDHKLAVLCMQVVENILFSGSADTVVQSHNINTGELVRSYAGHTMSVSGLQAVGGVLVTSSLDRVIRCFDIRTGDLLQLYGGNTDMIFSLSVHGDMIYTGCRDGRVSGIKLDLRKYHCCKWGDCSLKFGLLNHLKQHVQDHINQTIDFKSCFWDECIHNFPRGKQLDVIQAATEHILSHVPNTKG